MSLQERTRATRKQARLVQIGNGIRSARKAQRMTLEALAASVGLSLTFLSRLERGQVACSIGNLLEIAGVLDLSPALLFADTDEAARLSPYRVVRTSETADGAAPDTGPYQWRQLASGRGEQRIESFLLDLPRGAKHAPLVTHPGEEFCYVLDGRVEFQVGDEIVTLAVGDSIHLRSDVPHMAWSAGRSRARILMVTAIEHQSATAVEWWAHRGRKRAAPDAKDEARRVARRKRKGELE